MSQRSIDDRLSRLSAMVDGWNRRGEVSRLERDLALEELRQIYDEVLDYVPVANVADNPAKESRPNEEAMVDVAVADVAVAAVVEEAEEAEEEKSDVGDAFDDALDIDALLGLSGDDAIDSTDAEVPSVPNEVVEEHIEKAAVEVIEEPAEEPAEEQMPAENTGGGLFDIDDIPVQSKNGRKMISLYDTPVRSVNTEDEETIMPEAEPEAVTKIEADTDKVGVVARPAVETKTEEPKRLGDIFSKGVTVLGDKMASEEQPTAVYNKITDIRKAIGLNDKFLMIRDLFDGDAARYEATIDTLNEFEDLDDCMIYIAENFRWNPDSEGAKLLVSLIERKLS